MRPPAGSVTGFTPIAQRTQSNILTQEEGYNMNDIQLPCGVVVTAGESRALQIILERLGVHSDTAVQLRREFQQAIRAGKAIKDA